MSLRYTFCFFLAVLYVYIRINQPLYPVLIVYWHIFKIFIKHKIIDQENNFAVTTASLCLMAMIMCSNMRNYQCELENINKK